MSEPNYLEMSDDDILKMAVPEAPAEEVDEEPAEDLPPAEPAPSDDVPADEDLEDEDEPEATDKETGDQPGDAGGKAEGEAGDAGTSPAKPAGNQAPDLKQFYEQLTAPLKASGKELKFNDPAEMRRLMQMGVDYNEKMAAFKPHRKMLKLLENNGLLDEQKLSFYIDVDKGNPAAIAKLLKDSKVDPMDLNVDQDGYEAKTYSVDDREIELDAVLDDLRGSAHYAQLLETVSKKWDTASKQIIHNNPAILNSINDHMASGVYDVVTTEVVRQQALGKLKGLSYLEAYKQVGDEIHARGGFAHLFPENNGPVPGQQVAPPAPKAPENPGADKRRAARATKATPAPAKAPDFNPLALDDEEFEKQFASQYR
jgi:hypothetical protein